MIDLKKRTCWPTDDPLLVEYHDTEWGIPLHFDRRLFEFLVLEGFQAGLSWITILRKRKHFREAFDDFDFCEVAGYGERKVGLLLEDPGIIRNRLKIEGTVANAKAFLSVRKEFGDFDRYIWGFVQNKPIQNNFTSLEELPSSTELSGIISADLKKRGFRFVGPTVVYAHMQATGMVNDHLVSCPRHMEIAALSLKV